MTFNGKHRPALPGSRNGAAALMIGGLVATSVAAAGAFTLTHDSDEQQHALSTALTGNLAAVVGPDPEQEAQQAVALGDLRSASLSELREQTAADRSEARTAPEDADGAGTMLAASGFTGRTVAPAPVAEEVTAAPAETQAVEQPVAAETTEAPAQTQASAPASEPQPAVAAEPEPEPEPAPAPAPAPAPVGGGVLGVAASYVGYPYQLYGTPPSSFDCSGFTWWVFSQAGYSIPKSVAGQRAAVTPVSNPQPGDLIFYNDWHHVGIYAGGGMTYEALNPSTGVRYGPILSSNVWYGRLG